MRQLRCLQLRTRAIMLLHSRERELITDAFRCLKTLSKCIHAVHQGQIWANSQHLGYLLDALEQALPLRVHDVHGIGILSKREEDVVKLVAQGLTNRDISTRLRLSEHTVRNYLFRVFDKVGVSTRVELVLYYLQQGQTSNPANVREAL
jgi:DNA-binding NarL/FixJ family response regulator